MTSVSTATRLCGSTVEQRVEDASREIWSQILSGWPSVTDSDVKSRSALMWWARVPSRSRRRPPRSSAPRQRRRGCGRPLTAFDPVASCDYIAGRGRCTTTALLVGGEALGPADPVDDEQVDALALAFARPSSSRCVVVGFGLGGEADDAAVPSCGAWPSSGEDVGVAHELRASMPRRPASPS